MGNVTAIAALGPAGGLLVGLAAGTLLGFLHFGSLLWNTRLYLDGGWATALGLQLLRFGLLVVCLAGLAMLGALPLLGAALGLLLARGVLVRWAGRSA
jgi:F1F0 ATPase subunit 2